MWKHLSIHRIKTNVLQIKSSIGLTLGVIAHDRPSTRKQESVLFLRNITESIYSKKVDVYDFENNKISRSIIDTLIST